MVFQTHTSLDGTSQDHLTKNPVPSMKVCQFNIEGINGAKCHGILCDKEIDVVVIHETHPQNENLLHSKGKIPG